MNARTHAHMHAHAHAHTRAHTHMFRRQHMRSDAYSRAGTTPTLLGCAGGVAAPQHVSPAKASLGVGGLVGGIGLLAGDMATPLLGMEPFLPLGAVEALTLATLAASAAGELTS